MLQTGTVEWWHWLLTEQFYGEDEANKFEA